MEGTDPPEGEKRYVLRGSDRETGEEEEHELSQGEALDLSAQAAGWFQDEDGEWHYQRPPHPPDE